MLFSLGVMIGLFLLLSFIVSLGLTIAASGDDFKIIIKTTLKNFLFLCCVVMGIGIFVFIVGVVL